MPSLVVGTSGWAYTSWKPEFYPPEVSSKKFLNYYSSQLNGVEVNYTFRHLLSDKTQQAWIEQTPASFRFAIKAHQRITHFQRLRNADNFLQDFVNTLAPLASAKRLGPILFQLPPQLKCNLELLQGFIARLPKNLLCAF